MPIRFEAMPLRLEVKDNQYVAFDEHNNQYPAEICDEFQPCQSGLLIETNDQGDVLLIKALSPTLF